MLFRMVYIADGMTSSSPTLNLSMCNVLWLAGCPARSYVIGWRWEGGGGVDRHLCGRERVVSCQHFKIYTALKRWNACGTVKCRPTLAYRVHFHSINQRLNWLQDTTPMRNWPNADLMLDQRLRRWPTLNQNLVSVPCWLGKLLLSICWRSTVSRAPR